LQPFCRPKDLTDLALRSVRKAWYSAAMPALSSLAQSQIASNHAPCI
jgi:hypothetical protein